jgi:ankyrin repeat protein
VTARDSRGYTALLSALTTHYYKSDVVRVLLEHGAEVNAVASSGLTPVMCAYEPEFMKMLIDRGVNIHAIDGQGRSVLYHHAQTIETARILVEKGARPQRDEPIAMHAIRGDYPCFDCAYLLLDNGVDLEARDRHGATLLMDAIGMDELKFVNNLLARGADVKAVDLDGNTPLHKAGFVEYAELLLAKGVYVDARNKAGQTPLMVAKHVKIAEVLIRSGAQVNAQDNEGNTPLIKSGDVEMTQLLLKNRADTNARNKKGHTALTTAAERGDSLSATLLVRSGIDINARTLTGDTALSIAVRKKDAAIADLLRKAGAR